MEKVYINFMNKAKGFAIDCKIFSGKNAYENAVKWGKKNLDNFNHDMIHYQS